MPLAGRRVVLGVSGGIACYKSCTLARRLTEEGADVTVVLTAAAAEFVRPVVFEALTGRPVLTSLWERGRALAHIALAKDTDLVILAPATAQLLARAAQGMADDLLTALLLARSGPILCAPAMNDAMYAHPASVANLKTLTNRGWHVIGPEIGALAEGPSVLPGRMSEPETILAAATRLLARDGPPASTSTPYGSSRTRRADGWVMRSRRPRARAARRCCSLPVPPRLRSRSARRRTGSKQPPKCSARSRRWSNGWTC